MKNPAFNENIIRLRSAVRGEMGQAAWNVVKMALFCFFVSSSVMAGAAKPFGIAAAACLARRGGLNIYLIPVVLAGMLGGVQGGYYPWGDFIAAVCCAVFCLKFKHKAVSAAAVLICNIGYYLMSGLMYRFRPEFLIAEAAVVAACSFCFDESFANMYGKNDGGIRGERDKRSVTLPISTGIVICGLTETVLRIGAGSAAAILTAFCVTLLFLLFYGYFSGPAAGLCAGASLGSVLYICGIMGSSIIPITVAAAALAGLAANENKLTAALYFCAGVLTVLVLVGSGIGSTGGNISLGVPAPMPAVLAVGLVFAVTPQRLMRRLRYIILDASGAAWQRTGAPRELRGTAEIETETAAERIAALKEEENLIRSFKKRFEERKRCFKDLALIYQSQDGRCRTAASYFKGFFEAMDGLEEAEKRERAMRLKKGKDAILARTGVSSYSGSATISGDSVVMRELRDGRTLLILADGMGKGDEAYRESHMAAETVARLIEGGVSPQQALKMLNAILLTGSGEESLVTVDAAILEKQTGLLTVCKAGAGATFIKRGGKKPLMHNFKNMGFVEVIRGDGLPVGIVEETKIFTAQTRLAKGDRLLMVSDGVTDSLRDDSEEWLKKALEEIAATSPESIADLIISRAAENYGAREKDDLTAICVTCG